MIILSAFMCLCNLMLATIIALQVLEHKGKECCISINDVLESVQTNTSTDFQPQGISEDVIVDSLRRVATFSKTKPITEVSEFLSTYSNIIHGTFLYIIGVVIYVCQLLCQAGRSRRNSYGGYGKCNNIKL